MIEIFSRAADFPIPFVFCILLAFLPTVAWFWFFGRALISKKFHLFLTFLSGMAAGGVMLVYQSFWGENFNAVFFSVEPQNFKIQIENIAADALLALFLVSLSVGFLEEFLKHWMTKKTDHRIFESIDDVIHFSIVGALGFAFLENIGYFFKLFVDGNPQNLFSLFFGRSIFVVFIHLLCSGIYGYFYGLGFFASPILKNREKNGVHTFIPEILHRLFHFRKAVVFRHQMATLGLLIAMGIHGFYDFLMNSDVLIFRIAEREIAGHFLVLPVILIFGFWYLQFLLAKKEDQRKMGHLVEREVFVLENSPKMAPISGK